MGSRDQHRGDKDNEDERKEKRKMRRLQRDGDEETSNPKIKTTKADPSLRERKC